VITDAGQHEIGRFVALARKVIRRGQFLGGHPMAGKERRGAFEATRPVCRPHVRLTPTREEDLRTARAVGVRPVDRAHAARCPW